MKKSWGFILLMALTLYPTISRGQRSLTLEECRRMALESSEDVQKSSNAAESAALDKKIASSGYMPQVDGTASLFWLFPDFEMSGMSLQMRGAYSAGVSLMQPLFVGGKVVNGNKMAKIGVECAEQQQRLTRMEVLANVENAYWTYIAVREKVRLLETCMEQLDALAEIVNRSYEAEMGTKNDLVRIEAKRSEIRYNLSKARNGEQLCRMALCSAIGDSLDAEIIPADTLINIAPVSDLSDDISQRPEMKLMQKNIEVQELDVKMKRADHMPTVALAGGYLYYGNIDINGTTQLEDGSLYNYTQEMKQGMGVVMLTAQIPIFHGGKDQRNIQKSRLKLEDAKLDMQKNQRLMTIQAQRAVQNLTTGYEMCQSAQEAMAAADESLRVMSMRFDNGMATLTDMLDARTQWQQAKANLIEAQTQFKIAQSEYALATGRD